MKASISFPEIQNIICEKAKQSISLGYVDRKTISVTYPLNLGFIKKDISCNLIIKNIIGSDLLVQLSAGLGTDAILNAVMGLLKGKTPEGMLEKLPDSHLLLHLGKIEQMQSVFEKINVNDFLVFDNGIEVEGTLK